MIITIFSPEVAGHAAADRAKSDCAYDDLIRSLDKVLKDANFEELPHEDVTDVAGVPVILDLVDQLHGLRRVLRALLSADRSGTVR